MVYVKTYIFIHFYEQHLVLLTMVPRSNVMIAFLLRQMRSTSFKVDHPYNVPRKQKETYRTRLQQSVGLQ